MSGDPSDNGVPPDQATIERALQVAQWNITNEPRDGYAAGPDYWRGAAETLRWAVGLRATAPVSQQPGAVNLTEPRRSTINREAQYAYECMRGDRRPPEDWGMRYLTGAENTLCWVAGGRGFASPLDPEYVRDEYGIS